MSFRPITNPSLKTLKANLVTPPIYPISLRISPWLWFRVILLYLVIQLLENTLLVSRIQGDRLNMHPIAIIMVITIGSHYFSLWGVILGPTLVAMVKDVIVYFVQEWNRPPALATTESDMAAAEVVEKEAERPEVAVGGAEDG